MVRKVERKNIIFENVVRKTRPHVVFSKKHDFDHIQNEVKLREVVKVEYEIVPDKRILSVRV